MVTINRTARTGALVGLVAITLTFGIAAGRRSPRFVAAASSVRRIGMAVLPLRAQVLLRLIRAQGRLPRLRAPETFTDLVARNLLGRPSELIAATTDKVAVRSWVASLVDPDILPVRYQTVDRFDELDIETLPDAVVLKASHGSGMTIVATGQPPSEQRVVWDERVIVIDGTLADADRPMLRATTDRWLATNYASVLGEPQYEAIPRRLIAEEYLGSPQDPLVEVAFYCVRGNVVFAQLCRGDDLYLPVDRSFRGLSIDGVTGVRPKGELPAKPEYFDTMVSIAETLAAPFDCVRIDLFFTGGRIIFSEVTHTTIAGRCRFSPAEFSSVFGSFWRGEHTIPERFYA